MKMNCIVNSNNFLRFFGLKKRFLHTVSLHKWDLHTVFSFWKIAKKLKLKRKQNRCLLVLRVGNRSLVFRANHLFFVSERAIHSQKKSDLLYCHEHLNEFVMVTHLSCATWTICSPLLFLKSEKATSQPCFLLSSN